MRCNKEKTYVYSYQMCYVMCAQQCIRWLTLHRHGFFQFVHILTSILGRAWMLMMAAVAETYVFVVVVGVCLMSMQLLVSPSLLCVHK